MAQDVVINNVTYQDVPSVAIPKSGSGTATFYDTSDATLDAGGKLLNGVTAYSNGTKYTGTIETKTGSDLTASADTVTVPSGYYASAATKAVASGSVTAPSTITGSTATVSSPSSNTIQLKKTVSVTPNVTAAGYISAGTAGNAEITLTGATTTKGAATITPGTSNQTISSGTYLTGTQTISGDANLVAANIKSGVSIFGVSGSLSSVAVSQDSVTKVLSIS